MKKKLTVLVDFQEDFAGNGALATKEAREAAKKAADYLNSLDEGEDVAATKDTHYDDYLKTQEGRKLPVEHTIKGSPGWQYVKEIEETAAYQRAKENLMIFEKETFGSRNLAEFIRNHKYDEVDFIGVCTGICVISNALMAKAFAPETNIRVLKDMCACVTPESHETALKAMELCQIEIV